MTKGTWPLSTADALPQALVELAVLLDECPSDPEEVVVRLHQKVAHGALGQGLRGHLQLASNGPELGFLLGRQLQRDRHTNLWPILLRLRAAAAAVCFLIAAERQAPVVRVAATGPRVSALVSPSRPGETRRYVRRAPGLVATGRRAGRSGATAPPRDCREHGSATRGSARKAQVGRRVEAPS